MRVAGFQRTVQSAQKIAVGPRLFRCRQGIENRLVVLVHEHDHPLARLLVKRRQQPGEATARAGRADFNDMFRGEHLQLVDDIEFKRVARRRAGEIARAKIQPHYGMPPSPIVARVQVETVEQFLRALEQLLYRVEQQTLAEAAGAGEETMLAAFDQAPYLRGFVGVIVTFLPQLTEVLNTDRKPPPHAAHL